MYETHYTDDISDSYTKEEGLITQNILQIIKEKYSIRSRILYC